MNLNEIRWKPTWLIEHYVQCKLYAHIMYIIMYDVSRYYYIRAKDEIVKYVLVEMICACMARFFPSLPFLFLSFSFFFFFVFCIIVLLSVLLFRKCMHSMESRYSLLSSTLYCKLEFIKLGIVWLIGWLDSVAWTLVCFFFLLFLCFGWTLNWNDG